MKSFYAKLDINLFLIISPVSSNLPDVFPLSRTLFIIASFIIRYLLLSIADLSQTVSRTSNSSFSTTLKYSLWCEENHQSQIYEKLIWILPYRLVSLLFRLGLS